MLLNYYRRQAVAQCAQTCKTKQEDNKMKKLVALAMSLTMAFSLVACGNSDASANAGTDTTATSAAATTTEAAQQTAPAEKQDVSLRMWGAEEDQPMLLSMIDSFKEHYADYANFDIQLGTESESTAKDTVLTDIEAAADVYSFASDQLIDLVNAGALQSIDEMDAALEAYAGKSVADVKSANAPGSVDAATKDGTLYAFPMSADNGYFLYYNSELVTPEDAQTWDTLLAAAEKAGKKVGMTLASGWYNASFFYGAGFTTALNDDGSTAMDWNGTSADGVTGVQVVQSMLGIAGNSAFLPIADGDISNQIASGDLCAVISGTWDASAAQTAFGDGYAATKLPTYTCGDKQIQQGSVAGFKLVGVNKYSANAGWATLLADWITDHIGDGWITNLPELAKLKVYADDKKALQEFMNIKYQNKVRLAKYIKEHNGIDVDPDSIFDVQVKRLHEYKRQLLNILHVMYLYNEIKEHPDMEFVPRTFIFGAKAAAGYKNAKLTIKLINSVAEVINNDKSINNKIKVVFIEDYKVSNAEWIFAAADVSEQISTASKEASGTGNMKFMLNGALTLGTMDGANVEMYEEVGPDNMFIFGMSSDEVIAHEHNRDYDPMQIFNTDQDIRKVLTQLVNGFYSPNDSELFRDLYNSLLNTHSTQYADTYFILADFRSYAEAQKKIMEYYKNRSAWAKSAILNTAHSGKFSSDRTIQEYVDDIWHLPKVKVDVE